MSLITEAQIRGLVLVAEGRLSDLQLRVWNDLTIEPEVWSAAGGAAHGFGFWVVARSGPDIVWYDSMHEGFCYGIASRDGVLPDIALGPAPLEVIVDGGEEAQSAD